MSKIFSFDLGSGSIGECVRDGEEIKHLSSLLIDSEFASLVSIRRQRRAFRTRFAHKARESWWIQIALQAGLDIPGGDIKKDRFGNYIFSADERMLREFPKDNDDTVYNSALLRIALIQGRRLESWQIFKAVWSAFQHRGYEYNNWQSEEALSEEEKKSEKEGKEASELYNKKLALLPEEYRLPCYYEAFKMGLWDYKTNKSVNRLRSATLNARNKDGKEQVIAPRAIVERELRFLLDNAKKQFPSIPDTEYVLYGTNRKPHAGRTDHNARKYESEGLLGQKTPRFDNRIIGKCSLIPRLNVCKSQEPLSMEVRFLLALKNFRFIKNGEVSSFDFEEINELFFKYKDDLQKIKQNYIGKRDLKNYLKSKEYEAFSEDYIPAPKTSGRSRFCRPALKILKELILSGKNPHDFYKEVAEKVTNIDVKKGLVKEDYKFLLAMPNDWYRIHIPDFREEDKNLSKEERLAKIDDLLSSISNVIVRHRLIMLMRRIEYLDKKYGMPDYCVLEIGREEFISEKEKNELNAINKKNQKQNEQAYNSLKKYGLTISGENMEKYKLCEAQKWIDIYNVFSEKRNIIPEELENYDIDHIVPISLGGADSFQNKIVTLKELNQSKKGNKTPYEWLFSDKSKWENFLENIKKADIDAKSTKYLYLTSPDSVKEAKSLNDLQATKYIEKLAKKLICLYFGWGEQTAGDIRKMFVCTGGLTAKIRSIYGLNRLLHKDLSKEEFKKLYVTGKLDEKNRGNKKHHALDALVISFARNIKYDDKGKPVLPDFACKPDFFDSALDKVFPIQLRSKKPVLRETVYALRARQEGKEVKYYMVSRFNTRIDQLFIKIFEAEKNVKNIFDLSVKKAFEEKLASNPTQEEWEKFLKEFRVSGNPVYKISMINSKAFTKQDVMNEDGSLKTDIGEYRAMGKVRGQYLMPKEGNKGQVIYNNGEKWAVEQIYPFDSIVNKLKEFKEKYGKVLFWNTGATLCLPNKVQGVKLIKIENEETKKKSQKSIAADINPGKYKLNTISSGRVVLTSDFGAKYMISLKNFIEEGKAYKIDKGAIL